MDPKTKTDLWNSVYAAACASTDPAAAAQKADAAVRFTERLEADKQKTAEATAAAREVREESGMADVGGGLFAIRLGAWEATLGAFITGIGSGHGRALAAAWGALSPEQQADVDAGRGWPGGTYRERQVQDVRGQSGMLDLPADVWERRWDAWGSGFNAHRRDFGSDWTALSADAQAAIDSGLVSAQPWDLWKVVSNLAPAVPGNGDPPAPGIFTVWAALNVSHNQGIGDNRADRVRVGLFARASDAVRAAKGLCNHPGEDGAISPVRVLSLDGRGGWEVPPGLEPVALCNDIDAYLRERAAAKLTAEEAAVSRLVAPPPVDGVHPLPSPGKLTVYEAAQGGQYDREASVGLFVRKDDAATAAIGGAGPGAVRPVEALTLDGCTGWALRRGVEPSGRFEIIHHDVEAYLRRRALAKFTGPERAAYGLPEERVA
jgi:hypothetical protein